MANPDYERLAALCSDGDSLEKTVQYLIDSLKPIVKKDEATLICFPREKETDLGALMEKAVSACGSQPVFWEKDLRWKTLLRTAFLSKASTIIAPPLITLGLSKLAAYEGIPLYFYHAVMAGYPCLDWEMDGIEKGLDCNISGFLGPGTDAVLSGFSCECGRGVHIRDDVFDIQIVDESGEELPDGQYGRMVIANRKDPSARFVTKTFGRFMDHRCPCGNPAPKLDSIDLGDRSAMMLLKLSEDLLYWNSILDCRLSRTEYGLDLEVVVLRGEKLPKLPNCAKLVVRPWDPETDVPMSLSADRALP